MAAQLAHAKHPSCFSRAIRSVLFGGVLVAGLMGSPPSRAYMDGGHPETVSRTAIPGGCQRLTKTVTDRKGRKRVKEVVVCPEISWLDDKFGTRPGPEKCHYRDNWGRTFCER